MNPSLWWLWRRPPLCGHRSAICWGNNNLRTATQIAAISCWNESVHNDRITLPSSPCTQTPTHTHTRPFTPVSGAPSALFYPSFQSAHWFHTEKEIVLREAVQWPEVCLICHISDFVILYLQLDVTFSGRKSTVMFTCMVQYVTLNSIYWWGCWFHPNNLRSAFWKAVGEW